MDAVASNDETFAALIAKFAHKTNENRKIVLIGPMLKWAFTREACLLWFFAWNMHLKAFLVKYGFKSIYMHIFIYPKPGDNERRRSDTGGIHMYHSKSRAFNCKMHQVTLEANKPYAYILLLLRLTDSTIFLALFALYWRLSQGLAHRQ